MAIPRILLQLDPDSHASVFDAVVAIDVGVDKLLQHRDVCPEQVRDLVNGCIFTRGPSDLHNTAIFIGGQQVPAGEALLEAVLESFVGPMRVSVMLDANGCNTTAAAAVLAAARHMELAGCTALVLAGTGPVGERAARLLAGEGATVRVASRQSVRAEATVARIETEVPDCTLVPVQTAGNTETLAALEGVQLVIAAGAEGIELLPPGSWEECPSLEVAIDLNAVPPLGIAGIDLMDQAADQGGKTCYGAIGVGGTKMKIHKAALQRLFHSNDQVLDAEVIFGIGKELEEQASGSQDRN